MLTPTVCLLLLARGLIKRSYRPSGRWSGGILKESNKDYRATELQQCVKDAKLTASLQTCRDDLVCSVDTNFPSVIFEHTTVTGRDTVEVVQAALSHSWSTWKHSFGSIDLFVRTGCRDADEVHFLFQSIEIFWPRSIGSIVVVLDESDGPVARQSILPSKTKHNYLVFYERHPCMPGRVFNQISYLMADYYSDAEVIVTIDADCVLHSPVTPTLLFDAKGRILVPWSARFQFNMWKAEVEFFVGKNSYLGHSMVSQPVVVHRSTLQAYREWYLVQNNRTCFLHGIARFLEFSKVDVRAYCWMCQILAFIQYTKMTADKYLLVQLEDSGSVPYRRYALHIPYETRNGGTIQSKDPIEFSLSVGEAIRQGLCRSLGENLLISCSGIESTYVETRLFSYASYNWSGQGMRGREVDADYLHSFLRSLSATSVTETAV